MIIKYGGFRIDLGDKSSDQFTHNRAAFAQVFLADQYSLLLSHIKPGDVVIDAGANIGTFTIRASRIVGSHGKVYAIEPNLSNLSFLRRNLELNEIRNVEIIPRALYVCDDKTVKFGGMGVAGKIMDNGSQSVDTISLQSIIKNIKESSVHMKMDIEGGEERVFASPKIAESLRNLHCLMYEVHSASGETLLHSVLRSGGFKISKGLFEHNFIKSASNSLMRHPVLVLRLYGRSIFNLSKRVMFPTESDQFEPHMYFASRNAV